MVWTSGLGNMKTSRNLNFWQLTTLDETFTTRVRISCRFSAEGGLSLDSRSADKELKAVTPEKNKDCVTPFIKKVGNNFLVTKNKI